MKLYNKLLYLLLLISIIPVLILTVLFYKNSSISPQNFINREYIDSIKELIPKEMNLFFGEINKRLTIAKKIEQNNLRTKQEVKELISEELETSKIFSGIFWVKEDFTILTGMSENESKEPGINKSLLEQAFETMQIRISTISFHQNNAPYIDVVYPLDKKPIEYVYYRVKFQLLISKLMPYIKENNNIVIIDKLGSYISLKNQGKIEQKQLDKYMDLAENKIEFDTDRMSLLMIKGPRWLILYQEPVNPALSALAKPKPFIFIYSIIIMILLIIVSIISAKLYFKPITKIIKDIRLINNGDLSHQITKPDTAELSELVDLFNSLIVKLSGSQKDVMKMQKDELYPIDRVISDLEVVANGNYDFEINKPYDEKLKKIIDIFNNLVLKIKSIQKGGKKTDELLYEMDKLIIEFDKAFSGRIEQITIKPSNDRLSKLVNMVNTFIFKQQKNTEKTAKTDTEVSAKQIPDKLINEFEIVAEGNLDYQIQKTSNEKINKLIDCYYVLINKLRKLQDEMHKSEKLSAPIDELIGGLEIISEGNLNYQIPKPANEKLGRLIELFYILVNKLKKLQDGIYKSEKLSAPIDDIINDFEIINSGDYNHRFNLPANDKLAKLVDNITILINRYKDLATYARKIESQKEQLPVPVSTQQNETLNIITSKLKYPLETISNTTNFIKLQVSKKAELDKTDSEIFNNLPAIENAVNFANMIINDGLYYYQDTPSKLQEANINELIKNVIEGLNIPDKIKLQAILTRISKLNLDVEELKQVIRNLLTNAIDSMQGKSTGILTIRTIKSAIISTNKSSILIEIADTGCGIPKACFTKIFEPYFTTKKNAVGLGLTVVKKIIENKYKGTITIKSDEDSGTIISLNIPAPETDEAIFH